MPNPVPLPAYSPTHARRFIAIEGPIGAGKTSLARRLAAQAEADLLLEQPAENPFLARFYQDRPRYALPTQLFFLFQRTRQLETLAQSDLFARSTVADFLLEKDPLFARLTLREDEFALYQRIYDAVRPAAPTPDLVIYLQAPLDVLLARIRRRAAVFERAIDDDYLVSVIEGYARFFHHYDRAPVLMVNSENLDFIEREADFELLVGKIRGMKSRREYFNLG
jgi:deoxyadenosine/deoxycytidine kinase